MSKSKSAQPAKRIGQDFPCPVVFSNTLPGLPFEAKLVSLDASQRRVALSQKDSLASFALDVVHNTHDAMQVCPLRMGLVWDPPRASSTPLDPKDKALLAPFAPPPPKKELVKTAAAAAPSRPIASWLRRTFYIADEDKKPSSSASPVPRAPSAPKVSTKDSLLAKIDASFVHAAQAHVSHLKHPTNPSLTAMELLPVFPAFEQWPDDFYTLVFDADPVGEAESTDPVAREEAVLKFHQNMHDPNERILSFYAPTADASRVIVANKALDEEEDEDEEDALADRDLRPLDFKLVRDFTFREEAFGDQVDVGANAANSADHAFVFLNVSEEVVTFKEVKGRVELVRKRVKPRTFQNRYDADLEFPNKPTLYQTAKRARTRREKHDKVTKMHAILPLEYPEPEEFVEIESEEEEEEEEDRMDVGGGGEPVYQQQMQQQVQETRVVDEDGDAEW
ncbi:hypothetical protein HDU98_006359 [Podochytrium sp. JEL0797]|nr:hypothetical protein HDU98_006359 [Podochytrium sp. JEL0797]